MFNIGGYEFLVIFAIALIVLGPKRIPEVARYLGRAMRQFREAAAEVKRNLNIDDMDDLRKEMRDTWRSTRNLNSQTEERSRKPPETREDKPPKAEEKTDPKEEKDSTPPGDSTGQDPHRED